jgi:hypothetical protein
MAVSSFEAGTSGAGAEPSLRSRQSLSFSRISQDFTQPEVLLPYSQELSNCFNPEPD